MIQKFKKFDLISDMEIKNEYKDSIAFPQLMKSTDCDWIYQPGYGRENVNTYESDDEDTSEYKNQQFETYYFATHLGGSYNKQFKFFLFVNVEKAEQFEKSQPWLSLTTIDSNQISCCTNRGHAFAYRLFPFCTNFTSDFSKITKTEEIVKDLIKESSEETVKKIENKKWVLYELNFLNFIQDDMMGLCLFYLDKFQNLNQSNNSSELINSDSEKFNFLRELSENNDIFTVSREVESKYGIIQSEKIENLQFREFHQQKLLDNPKEWAMPDNEILVPCEKLYEEFYKLDNYEFKMKYYFYNSSDAKYRSFHLVIDDLHGNTSYFFL